MSIVTQTMLAERLPSTELIRLTDDTAAGAVDAENLARAISEGEAEILGPIGQRYTLPLVLGNAQTAQLVTTWLTDAVVYRLYLRRPPVMDDYVRAHDAAVKAANAIAEGKSGLTGEAELSASLVGGGAIAVDSVERVISRESMRGL